MTAHNGEWERVARRERIGAAIALFFTILVIFAVAFAPAVLDRLKDPAQAHAEAVAEVARIRDALELNRVEEINTRAAHRRNMARLVRAEYGDETADILLRAIHGDARAAAYVRHFVERTANADDAHDYWRDALTRYPDIRRDATDYCLADFVLARLSHPLYHGDDTFGDERAMEALQSSSDSLEAFVDYLDLSHRLKEAKARADAMIIAKRASEATARAESEREEGDRPCASSSSTPSTELSCSSSSARSARKIPKS